MTDSSTHEEHDVPPAPVIHHGMSKAEVNEILANHRRQMEDKFQADRASLLDEIRNLGSSDMAEKEELKAHLKRLTDWQDQMIKAQEEKDKVVGDEHTIVVPPDELSPPTPPAPSNEQVNNEHHHDETSSRKRGIGRFW